LRVFDAVESEEQAGCTGFHRRIRLEEVFDGKRLLWTHVGYNALVGGGLRYKSQLLARFLTDSYASVAALCNETLHARIVTFAGDQYVIKAAASGLESFLDWMQTVQDFHEASVEDRSCWTGPGFR
jgi:hypothetical protein